MGGRVAGLLEIITNSAQAIARARAELGNTPNKDITLHIISYHRYVKSHEGQRAPKFHGTSILGCQKVFPI